MPTRADYLELQDRALRRGTFVARFAAGLSRRQALRLRQALRGRLTDRVAGALARVRSRGALIGPHSRVGLREGLASFDRGLRDTLESIETETKRELRELADEEGDHEAALLLALFGSGVATASRFDLRRPVVAGAVAGETTRQQFRAFEANVRRGLRQEVQAGLAAGEALDALLRRITGSERALGLFDRAEASLAQRIETLATGIATQAREAVYEKSEAVQRVLWIATLDGRVCPRCAALHGRKFPVNEGTRPPIHANCRCVVTPAGSGSDVVAIDFSSWLRRQPLATQNEILGATRARLFRDDKIALSRFVSGNRVLTLEELRARGIQTDPFPNTPTIFRS